MKGTVKISNIAKGIGFIVGEDGKEYFFHFSQIQQQDEWFGINVLLRGWTVEFTPTGTDGDTPDKGPQAKNIIPPAEKPGLKRHATRRLSVRDGRIPLVVGQNVSISFNGVILLPETEGESFRAYHVGHATIKGFDLTTPSATPQEAWLLLDQDKNPRRSMPDNRYENVGQGSYLLRVDIKGRVAIWNLGRRNDFQSRPSGDTWVIIEKRFEHTYDLSRGVSEQILKAQTPTTGKKRDNDGFIPGILRGLGMIGAATKPPASS